MAKTAQMRLIELMVLKQDISVVIEYIGRKGSFQFQKDLDKDSHDKKGDSKFDADADFYNSLKNAAINLGLLKEDETYSFDDVKAPTDQDREEAGHIISTYSDLSAKLEEAEIELAKSADAEKEALAFANLKVSYSELGSLSFLSLRIGKIDGESFDELKQDLEGSAVLVALGDDNSHILVATSKKTSAEVDVYLKKSGFVELEVPEDFKGVPEDVLNALIEKRKQCEAALEELNETRKNFGDTHKDKICALLKSFALGVQISNVERKLESTELVYRITGWIPAAETETYMRELDSITEGRIAIREYSPFEVPSVVSGKEQVPVKLNHGKFVKSFERMIFSYSSPMYGMIDPTPFVAVFFTILFGIMFGDFGQGLVFLIAGILMALNVIKVGGWNKFAPIFMAIGISSSIMGLLTGEFFGTETILEPFAHWVTGLFGTPHAPILKLMPSADPKSIYVMFGVFGVAVAFGFIINSCGLIINMINNFSHKKYAEALFGKNGLAGTVFFWYVVALVLRIVLAKHSIAVYDWIILGVSLFFAAFAEPFERKMKGEETLFENGFGTYVISGVVELIEVISGYLSNTVSFVRVGAFALSHAVLNFTILTLTELVGGPATIGGIVVLIAGNAMIIVLEGMIVAIQVIRLQYYEFFSKFFHETGREFTPFKFEM